MHYCLVVKELCDGVAGTQKRMLAYSDAEQQDIIERATEREMTRSVIESKGSERHSDKRNN